MTEDFDRRLTRDDLDAGITRFLASRLANGDALADLLRPIARDLVEHAERASQMPPREALESALAKRRDLEITVQAHLTLPEGDRLVEREDLGHSLDDDDRHLEM